MFCKTETGGNVVSWESAQLNIIKLKTYLINREETCPWAHNVPHIMAFKTILNLDDSIREYLLKPLKNKLVCPLRGIPSSQISPFIILLERLNSEYLTTSLLLRFCQKLEGNLAVAVTKSTFILMNPTFAEVCGGESERRRGSGGMSPRESSSPGPTQWRRQTTMLPNESC